MMAVVRREAYEEYGAAGRLRVPVAAWRWAAGTGLIPAADAGPGRWSRAVVEAADAEAVHAALRGPVGAGWAADRLTEALGVPLPRCRPRVTASAVGYLVKAGLLVYLGGEVEFPDVHPDQVAALGRRRDLPALLDRYVQLGPDQAARRLGVRRTDFDAAVRLGYVRPVGMVEVDYKKQGGVTAVPLFDAEEVALLPRTRPEVDWRAVRRTAPGRRSLLAALTPVVAGADLVSLAGAARIAGVSRATVAGWRRTLPGFPVPAQGSGVGAVFDRGAVVAWLRTVGKLTVPAGLPTGVLVLRGSGPRSRAVRFEDVALVLAEDAAGEDRLSGWTTPQDADALAELLDGNTTVGVGRLTVPGARPLAVLGSLRIAAREQPGAGGLLMELAWPAALRGTATRFGGVAHHAVLYSGSGAECGCVRHDCGGVTRQPWCPDHGTAAGRAAEDHIEGGLYCTQRAARRRTAPARR
ncbi:hypothetical protein ACFW6V_28375 [Streptomyces sp. NPDC058734]|uniref:hypothetical protein n=1 Tax=Streptomyces sp. NPDC058734 TaxID=3346615 RepID=UPI00369C16CD